MSGARIGTRGLVIVGAQSLDAQLSRKVPRVLPDGLCLGFFGIARAKGLLKPKAGTNQRFSASKLRMRLVPVVMAFTLVSCNQLERSTKEMTPDQLIDRSTHLFIGVIEKYESQNRLFFRVTGDDAGDWRVIRMQVRIENVLRGRESRPVIDIYEAFPTGALTGNWNATQDQRRYFIPVRLEQGQYHVSRDFWRSIYPIYSGRHDGLPLEDSHPFWERFSLLQWWIQPDRSRAFGDVMYTDPGLVLGRWRLAKILRGLFRHSDKDVRLAACESLSHLGAAQDECWDELTPHERQSLNRFSNAVPPEHSWSQNRNFERQARDHWRSITARGKISAEEKDEMRLDTAINNSQLRREFCTEFERQFPGDRENGCPADRVPPATIVTRNGDIPLVGAWPKD